MRPRSAIVGMVLGPLFACLWVAVVGDNYQPSTWPVETRLTAVLLGIAAALAIAIMVDTSDVVRP